MNKMWFVPQAFFIFSSLLSGKESFLLSRNKLSTQCIGFRFHPLDFFLKPHSTCCPLLYTFPPDWFIFFGIGVHSRLFLLYQKETSVKLSSSLPSYHSCPHNRFFAVPVNRHSHFSSVRVGLVPAALLKLLLLRPSQHSQFKWF